jgi:anaerobic magnesium-protoporphyrin IX monomethyl ester cyclase
MDILLASAYYLHEDQHELKIMKPYPPLGLLYVSSYLKARGFAVGVFDSTFQTRRAFGDLLARERPPVVGIYCNLLTKCNVLAMIREAKATGAIVVLGGPEPPYYAEEYLACGADVIVVGEGELTLEKLLQHLARSGPRHMEHVQGIVYREEDGGLVRTPARPFIVRLDDMPHPDRAAIDMQTYLQAWREQHHASSVSLICARGCSYTCAWCSHSVFGASHRRRSPENVVAEVEHLREMYNPDQLWYADDVMTMHRGWLLSYAALLKKRGIHLPFECSSRCDRLDEDVVQALADMGCYRLWLGAESGSQKVLDLMQRRIKVEDVAPSVRMLQAHRIEAGMFIMLGYEGEDMPELQESLELLKKANPNAFLTTVAYPIKGTPYYNNLGDRVIRPGPWAQHSDRDLSVAGRHSRRFYSFATRWMVGEVRLHELGHEQHKNVLRLAKAFACAEVGRLGMALSRSEVEGGAAPRAEQERGAQ